jgi:hypothetical protein
MITKADNLHRILHGQAPAWIPIEFWFDPRGEGAYTLIPYLGASLPARADMICGEHAGWARRNFYPIPPSIRQPAWNKPWLCLFLTSMIPDYGKRPGHMRKQCAAIR